MLEVKNVYKTYKEPALFSSRRQQILTDVTFSMEEGRCLGIIGESGSGKSTLGRLILGIEKPDSGEITFENKDVTKPGNRRGLISAVFQDYTSSISPNSTVYKTISETMDAMSMHCDREVATGLLKKVGLDETYLDRFPHELSGGQAQIVCIARAISTSPKFLLLDEAISSLDVSVQVQILQLLKDLRRDMNMSYLFITHDIQAAAYICDELIIFNEGRIIEQVPIEEIGHVKEDYSRRLLSAVITV